MHPFIFNPKSLSFSSTLHSLTLTHPFLPIFLCLPVYACMSMDACVCVCVRACVCVWVWVCTCACAWVCKRDFIFFRFKSLFLMRFLRFPSKAKAIRSLFGSRIRLFFEKRKTLIFLPRHNRWRESGGKKDCFDVFPRKKIVNGNRRRGWGRSYNLRLAAKWKLFWLLTLLALSFAQL